MTDRSKFEQMLEYLISEEQDRAREIFHQLVVEKSREIYETILSEDFEETTDEEVEEDYAFEADDEESDEDETDAEGNPIRRDATDDFMKDIDSEEGEEGEEDGGEGEGDIEDRVMDLEDALDDLRSEFEQMMGDEEGEEEHGDMDMGDEMGMDDAGMGMGMDEPMKDSFDMSDNFMREYIEKVSAPKHGDDGVNTRSPMAGKNDMGGTTANIAKGGTGDVAEAGAGGTIKGNGVMNQKVQDNPDAKKNINVPGGKAGKTAFTHREPGHGAEKKGAAEKADKGAGSPLNGAPKRAA